MPGTVLGTEFRSDSPLKYGKDRGQPRGQWVPRALWQGL